MFARAGADRDLRSPGSGSLLLYLATIRDIANGGDGQQPAFAGHRAQANLDGELSAVLAQGEQVETDAHGADSHVLGVVLAVRHMPLAKAFRQEDFDALTPYFACLVPEELRDLMIREYDRPGRINN